MANKTYYYRIKNRSAGVVKYRIPENNIERRFAPGETKRIPYEEILQLSYQPGGQAILANFLQIDSQGVPASIGIQTQPEYYMSEAQIVELLKHGSMDAFLDCLDYAPTGVLELVKQYAVSLPLTDYNKRQALKTKTGFDVDMAIANSGKETDNAEDNKISADAPATGRRTNTNYKVVKQG